MIIGKYINISGFKRFHVSLRDVPYMWIVDIIVNEIMETEVWIHPSVNNSSHLVKKFSNCIPMDNVLRWMCENIGDFIRREYDGSHLD